MADEIQVSATLKVVNGNLNWSRSSGVLNFDQSAVGGPTPGYMTVGTSEETFAFPELTTEGWLFMKNLDDTNYVQWGFSTGVYGGRLKAKHIAVFNCEPGLTLYLKANVACKIELYCLET